MIFYRRLAPIQAMTFDLDDTLYENTSIIRRAESSLLNFIASHYPDAAHLNKQYWRDIQYKVLAQNAHLKNDMGTLRLHTLEAGFKQLGFADRDAKHAAKCGFEHFYAQRSNFSLDDKVHHVLTQLSQRLPLVAITNGNVDLNKIGIAEYFSVSFKASLDLPMKPDSAMFRAAQKHLNLPAKFILHVGDNLEKDVMGALRAGYQAAWYADDRPMLMTQEPNEVLPHVQLQSLEDLLALC